MTGIPDKYVLGAGGYYDAETGAGPFFIGADGEAIPLSGSDSGGSQLSDVTVTNWPDVQKVEIVGGGAGGDSITSAGNFKISNDAGKTAQFPDVSCKQLKIVSYGKQCLIYQEGKPYLVFPNTEIWFRGLTNANQLSVGCMDADPSSSAQVYCRWEK